MIVYTHVQSLFLRANPTGYCGIAIANQLSNLMCYCALVIIWNAIELLVVAKSLIV